MGHYFLDTQYINRSGLPDIQLMQHLNYLIFEIFNNCNLPIAHQPPPPKSLAPKMGREGGGGGGWGGAPVGPN